MTLNNRTFTLLKIVLLIIISIFIAEIAEYLNRETARIDSIIADVTEQIEKLKEYRQSIISEVVTGKVAVE